MHLYFENINDAFSQLVKMFAQGKGIVKNETRNGPVLVCAEPVTITCAKPRERVLFNLGRDANPFFHFFEALWMLAGRNDVESIQHYASTLNQFSDDGKTFNGAYGHRWRNHCGGEDQLNILINHLKENPTSRRAVLQMWNVEDDLLKIDSSKDVCCNTAIYFSINSELNQLDMTVSNRSNDLIWGTLGIDYVDLTMLQEYMANCIGIEVGIYNQFTNNLHIYTETNSGFSPEKWKRKPFEWGYPILIPSNIPLVKHKETFDREVKQFIENFDQQWNEPFLEQIAKPLMKGFALHKERNYPEAIASVKNCAARDWAYAGAQWLIKRRNNFRKVLLESNQNNE